MLGGSEFGTKLAQSLNNLAGEFKEEQFIIFGSNLNFDTAVNVKYLRYSDNFLKYLKISKGVITLAGQETLAEALSYEKPILCFPIQNHIEQVLNAYALRKIALISSDSSPKIIRQQLSEFIRQLPQLKQKVKRYNLKANGAEQVADIIENILLKNR